MPKAPHVLAIHCTGSWFILVTTFIMATFTAMFALRITRGISWMIIGSNLPVNVKFLNQQAYIFGSTTKDSDILVGILRNKQVNHNQTRNRINHLFSFSENLINLLPISVFMLEKD